MNVLGEERTSLLVLAIFTAFLATAMFIPALLHAGEHVPGGVPQPGSRFTDNGDGTVTDNHTKVIWLKNANRFGVRTYAQAVSDCKNLTDDGVSLKDGSSAGDWRLPTVKELESLVDYSQHNPPLPAGHPFTGVQSARYWASDKYSTATNAGWLVSMLNGAWVGEFRTDAFYVWPVRGGGHVSDGVPQPVPRFIDNGDGTVTDNLTRLIWLKNASRFGNRPWNQAVSDCKNLADDGVNLTDGSSAGDWRLPTIKESQSLLDYREHNPALPGGHPFTGVQADRYWTSTSYGTTGTCSAWSVNMENGGSYGDTAIDPHGVWPVRDAGVEPGGVKRPAPRFTPLESPRAEAGTKIQDSYAFSHGVNAPCESLLTGFTDNGDGTITDNYSGLIWLKNASRFGKRTWKQAINDCKNLTDDGVTLTDGSSAGDWRLPTVKEFQSLLDYGEHNPALPGGHPFTGVMRTLYYWSGTEYSKTINGAWKVTVLNGGVYAEIKNNPYYVWPVRGGGVRPNEVIRLNPRFTDNGDGTVTDHHSGLIWLKNANRFGRRTFAQAMDDCKNLADDGVTLRDGSSAGDWRLPTIKESQSLLDYGKYNPPLPGGHPFTDVESFYYWSGTPYGSSPCGAWTVRMLSGGLYGMITIDPYYVWPVRGSKSD